MFFNHLRISIIWVICSFLFVQNLYSQKSAASYFSKSKQANTIFLNAGTSIIYSSLNLTYERDFKVTARRANKLSLGWGIHKPLSDDLVQHYVLTIGTVRGAKKHHLDLNIGVTCFYNFQERKNEIIQNPPKDYLSVYPAAYVGYRYKNPLKRYFFRGGIGFPELLGVGLGLVF